MKKSKKIISLVLAIAMVLLVPVSVISAAPKGYGFRYAGVTVYVHGKASGLIDKMGEPNKKSKSKSCAYDGEDIKYVYDEFTLVILYREKRWHRICTIHQIYFKKCKDQRRNQDWKQRKNNEKEIWKSTQTISACTLTKREKWKLLIG